MRGSFPAFLLVACLLVASGPVVGPARAAPFAVQLGDTRVALDAPPGFSDTLFTGSPRLLELAETLTEASNRILLFAITDLDLRRFTVGDQPEFRRYMIAVTPKGMERERVGAAAFQRYVEDALRDLGSVPQGQDIQKLLDAAPAGRAMLLAELRRTPEAVSVLQGSRIPPPQRGEPVRYLLSTTTLLLVRGKAINLSVFTGFDQPQDVDWIRATTTRWIEDLQRLNGR